MKIITKKEAVDNYGNDAEKAHFAKYSRFVSKGYEEGLLRTLRTKFEYVKIINKPNGRGYVYELGEEKEEESIREDGRISNGAWSIPYTKNLDIIVVSVLEQGLETSTAQTLPSWAVDFTIITKELKEVLQARYHEGLRRTLVEDLKEKQIIYDGEDRIIDDFAQITKGITDQLASTLNRMAKAEIIEYYPVYKGHIKETDTIINLHENVYKEITTLKRDLLEKYNVDEWYINNFRNAKKTVGYKNEFNEQLALIQDENDNTLGLDYYYTAYAIILKARKKKIIRYLKKYNKEVIKQFKQDKFHFLNENEIHFHSKRKEHVINEAQKNLNKFMKPREFANELHEKFGGKKKKRVPEIDDYTYDTDYYKLYFEDLYVKRIGELQDYYGYNMFNNAGTNKPKQEKLNRTYTNQCKDNSKTNRDVEIA